MTKKQMFRKFLAVVTVVGLLLASNAVAADEETISGTIMQTDQGIVLSADDGEDYQVEGRDLSDMVGKDVSITGTLSEGESGKTITVIFENLYAEKAFDVYRYAEIATQNKIGCSA